MQRFQSAVFQQTDLFLQAKHPPDFKGNIGIEILLLDPFKYGNPEPATVDVGEDVREKIVVLYCLSSALKAVQPMGSSAARIPSTMRW